MHCPMAGPGTDYHPDGKHSQAIGRSIASRRHGVPDNSIANFRNRDFTAEPSRGSASPAGDVVSRIERHAAQKYEANLGFIPELNPACAVFSVRAVGCQRSCSLTYIIELTVKYGKCMRAASLPCRLSADRGRDELWRETFARAPVAPITRHGQESFRASPAKKVIGHS
jgi:hypothetical protein